MVEYADEADWLACYIVTNDGRVLLMDEKVMPQDEL